MIKFIKHNINNIVSYIILFELIFSFIFFGGNYNFVFFSCGLISFCINIILFFWKKLNISLGCICFIIISLIGSINLFVYFDITCLLGIFKYIYLASIVLLISQIKDINFLYHKITICGIILSILGIICYSFGINIFNSIINDNRLSFPFNNSNISGLFYVITFWLSIYLFKKYYKLLCIIPIISLLFTQSRGAILILLFFGIIICSLIIRKKKFCNTNKIIWILIIISLIIISIIFYLINFELPQTFIERLIQIYDGFLIAINNLFGIGANHYQYEIYNYQSAQYSSQHIHCGYLQIWLDIGIIGMALFIIYCVYSIIKLSSKPLYFIISLSILLHSIFDLGLEYISIWIILLGCLEQNNKLQIKKVSIINILSLIMIIISISGFIWINYNYSSNGLNYSIFKNDPNWRNNYIKANELIIDDNCLSYNEAINKSKLLFKDNNSDKACSLLLSTIKKQPYNYYLLTETYKLFKNYSNIINESYLLELNNLINYSNYLITTTPAVYLTNQKTITNF